MAQFVFNFHLPCQGIICIFAEINKQTSNCTMNTDNYHIAQEPNCLL